MLNFICPQTEIGSDLVCSSPHFFSYEETLVKASVYISKYMLSYHDLFYKKGLLSLACTSLQELHRKELKRVMSVFHYPCCLYFICPTEEVRN